MTSDDEQTGSAREEDERREATRTVPSGAPWLLRHKVEMPAPIDGYVVRLEVERRCALTERRLTVLHAPRRFRQDRPARPVLPGAARTGRRGRMALARRG